MPTSVRLDSKTENLVNRLARRRGLTKSEVIRQALIALADAGDNGKSGPTLYDRIEHVIGRVKGLPPDLPERTGRKFSALLRARRRR